MARAISRGRVTGESASVGDRGGGAAPGDLIGVAWIGSGPEDLPRAVIGDAVLVAPRGDGCHVVLPCDTVRAVLRRVAKRAYPGGPGGDAVLSERVHSHGDDVVKVAQVRGMSWLIAHAAVAGMSSHRVNR